MVIASYNCMIIRTYVQETMPYLIFHGCMQRGYSYLHYNSRFKEGERKKSSVLLSGRPHKQSKRCSTQCSYDSMVINLHPLKEYKQISHAGVYIYSVMQLVHNYVSCYSRVHIVWIRTYHNLESYILTKALQIHLVSFSNLHY